jgi:hypothetical protein
LVAKPCSKQSSLLSSWQNHRWGLLRHCPSITNRVSQSCRWFRLNVRFLGLFHPTPFSAVVDIFSRCLLPERQIRFSDLTTRWQDFYFRRSKCLQRTFWASFACCRSRCCSALVAALPPSNSSITKEWLPLDIGSEISRPARIGECYRYASRVSSTKVTTRTQNPWSFPRVSVAEITEVQQHDLETPG